MLRHRNYCVCAGKGADRETRGGDRMRGRWTVREEETEKQGNNLQHDISENIPMSNMLNASENNRNALH